MNRTCAEELATEYFNINSCRHYFIYKENAFLRYKSKQKRCNVVDCESIFMHT